MKNIRKFLSASTAMLALWTFVTTSYAQLVQYPTASTVPFHYMVYDPYVEGQIYAAEAPFDASQKPKLFISEDNGQSYRLLFEFDDPYKESEAVYWGRIMDLKPGKSSDVIYFQINKSHSPYSDGMYRLNHKTGELKHYQLPNAEKTNAALGSYDVFDADGDTVIMHTTWMLDWFILMTEIYYTTDGGENWEMIYDYVDHDFVHMARVAFSPDNPNKMFFLRSGGISGVQAGLLISEDAGKTYTEYLPGLDWGCIAFNPANPDEILLGTHMTSGTMTPPQHLMRSYDGGKTWEEIELEYTPFIYNYFTDIEYDPYDPNRIIVIEENQIFITDDGFKTYENLMPDNGAYMFGQNVSINPFNTDEMLVGIDGASVNHTLDRCHSWTVAGSNPHTGYGYTHAGISGINTPPANLYLTEKNRISGIGLGNGKTVFNLDNVCPGNLFTDPTRTDRFFLSDTSGLNLYLVERIKRSKENQPDSGILHLVKTFETASQITAIVPEAGTTNRYLAVVDGALFRIDAGLPSNITFHEITTNGTGRISTIASATNAIYMAKAGKVFFSADGNAWTEKSTGLNGAEITALAIDPTNTDHLLLSAGTRIFRSTDAAANWSVAVNGYTADNIAFSPLGDGNVMAGAYTAMNRAAHLLYSTDGGENWQTISSKALQHATTRSMAFEFGRTDTLVAHIASPDMGRLAYIIPLSCTENEIKEYPYHEGFETGLPLCYTQEKISGNTSWTAVKATDGEPAGAPQGSDSKLSFQTTAAAKTRLLLPALANLNTVQNPMLSFAYILPENAALNIVYKSGTDTEWNVLPDSITVSSEWTYARILLPKDQPEAIRIAIEASTATAAEIQLDNLKITASKGLPCYEIRDLTASVSYGSVTLSWTAPEANYNALYNLYRNNELLAENIGEPGYTDKNLQAGTFNYTVKAICHGRETEGIRTDVIYAGTPNPVRDLTVTLSNAINGNARALLNWKAPESYTDVNYHVYRDDSLIAKNLDRTNYNDRGFITDGKHTWSVAAVYGETLSEKTETSAVCSNRCAPISNLKISYDIPMQEVRMTWNKPGALPEDWLTYSYEATNGIGFEEYGGYEVFVAARYTVEDIKKAGLEGATITELSFVPGEPRATYFARIWIGGNGKTPGDEKFIQRILGRELEIGEWNSVSLNTPVTIEKNKELWIGYSVQYTGGSYAIGCDAGPMVKDRNMINLGLGDGWTYLDQAIDNADFNISVAARIRTQGGNAAKLSMEDNNIRYHIYRDGERIETTQKTEFSETGLPEDLYRYSVTAVHANGCESDSVSMDFFAGNTCVAVENFSAIAKEENGHVELAWNATPPFYKPETVLLEHFDGAIPETWTVLDKDGDGRSWRRSDSAHVLATCTPYMGAGNVFSEVYKYNDDYSADLLAPDNWLITPPIELSSGRAVLTYHVANIIMQSELTYYEVLISTEGTDYENFEVIDSDTIMSSTAFIYHDKTVDLAGYTGTVHIAFRHLNDAIHNTIGLQLDEVEVVEYVPVARTYNLYRNDEKIAGPIADTTYVDTKAPAGKHEWCVRAVCNELGHESNPACAEATINVGIETITRQADLRVYPNPAKERITIEKTGGPIREIKLFDMQGRLLRILDGMGQESAEIDLSNQQSGIYFLEIDGRIIKLVKE